MAGEYSVTELFVEPEDWLANRTLLELDLVAEGVLILGITKKDGSFTGTPLATTTIEPADNLILYGRVSCLMELDQRRKGKHGDREHEKAVAEQMEIVGDEFKGITE
ncbi:TrkA C-terminal domain-containing protein [Gemmatimonadota bacterium]